MLLLYVYSFSFDRYFLNDPYFSRSRQEAISAKSGSAEPH